MCCGRSADADGFNGGRDTGGRGGVDADDLYASDGEASISSEWAPVLPLESTTSSTGVKSDVHSAQHTPMLGVSRAETIHFNICHGVFVHACVSVCVFFLTSFLDFECTRSHRPFGFFRCFGPP